jgi:hypothetical protein
LLHRRCPYHSGKEELTKRIHESQSYVKFSHHFKAQMPCREEVGISLIALCPLNRK